MTCELAFEKQNDALNKYTSFPIFVQAGSRTRKREDNADVVHVTDKDCTVIRILYAAIISEQEKIH